MATIPEDRQKRLEMAKAWLTQTFALPDEEILDITARERAKLEAAVGSASDEQALFSPGEGQWSISEVARHISQAHRGCAMLVQSLAKGKVPASELQIGSMPEDPGDHEKVKAMLTEAFDALTDSFGAMHQDPNLTAKYAHPWFGEMNAREWFAFCSLHTMAHIRQVERIKASEGYPAV